MDFLNNSNSAHISPYTSWDTPQYNTVSGSKNEKAQTKSTSRDHQKPQIQNVNQNETTIIQVGKKLGNGIQDTASFFVYGDKKMVCWMIFLRF